MPKLESAIHIQTDSERAFSYIADYRHAPEYLPVISSIRPVNGVDSGVGSEFWCEARVNLINVGLGFKIVGFQPHSRVDVEVTRIRVSVLGDRLLQPEGKGTVTFSPLQSGMNVALIVRYELPPSLVIRTLAKRLGLEREIHHAAQNALWRLKQRLELGPYQVPVGQTAYTNPR